MKSEYEDEMIITYLNPIPMNLENQSILDSLINNWFDNNEIQVEFIANTGIKIKGGFLIMAEFMIWLI